MRLAIRDLRGRYGAVEVLKGILLEVRAGEIVALLGANGAGKTTTLMAISGVVASQGGSVAFDGSRVDGLSPEEVVRAGIVQVPEGRRVFGRLTVEENLRLGAFRRQDGAGITADLGHMWDLFPVLRERRRQLAGTLSGGEQQMLALARGLMARPRLLLLDEPSLGLAPKVVAQVFRVIQEINAAGLPILLVEQNAYQALRIAHRGYVLSAGEVVLSGSTGELMDNPAVKAAYLGG